MKAFISLSATIIAVIALVPPPPAPPREPLPAPVTDADYYADGTPPEAQVELGRLLFFDRILSGNRNISCATCHHPNFASADGVALPLGEGAHGLGPERRMGSLKAEAAHERVPRNSPALFNVGAREYTRMFHDGRVEVDTGRYYDAGFISPAKWKLPVGLDNVLAAQAMFPVTSPAEMAGQKGENGIADARSLNNVAGPGGVWEQVAGRVQKIPEYVERFKQAYPDRVAAPGDISMVMIANALAAYEATAFRSDNSPFDTYLRRGTGLAPAARRGMDLFYGKAGCASCHAGKFQTDHGFHAIAMPQIGPGKADGADPDYWRATGLKAFLEDYGRARETMRDEDRYRFRTPSLRNVALTGPWGHAGSYPTLEEVVRHHLNPVQSLNDYVVAEGLLQPLDQVLELTAAGPRLEHRWMNDTRRAAFLERDTWVQRNPNLRQRIAAANELDPLDLSDAEVADLLAFLESLTDPEATDLTGEIPRKVPSGLPID
jgi:cytochrome c peroxidase